MLRSEAAWCRRRAGEPQPAPRQALLLEAARRYELAAAMATVAEHAERQAESLPGGPDDLR